MPLYMLKRKKEEKKEGKTHTEVLQKQIMVYSLPDYFSEIYFPPLFTAVFSFILIFPLFKVEFLDLQHL